MGTSTDGILVFGIALEEGTEPGFLEDYDGDFDEFLNDLSGLPKYSESGHDFAEQQKFRENFPVDLTWHCSFEYPMYIVAVRGTKVTAHRGNPVEINPANLAISDEKKAALKEFCETYGIEWSEPKWWLVSMWG